MNGKLQTPSVLVTHFQRQPYPGAFSIERVYADVRAAMLDGINVRAVACRHYSRGTLSRLRSAWEARRHAAEVNHVTGDVHYLTYFLPKDKTILTIHDCVLIERTKGIRRFLLWFFWFWLPAKRCRWIVAISQETKRRILAHLRFDPDRIVVIPDPVSPTFRPVSRPFNRVRPRVLHIGTKANKNLERLIKALQGLEIELVVIGVLSPLQERLLEGADFSFQSRSGLSDEALRNEYVAADILAFVSIDEGFGLPILEAQAVGRAVLTSRKAPMDEVAGGGAVLVDPYDVEAIRKGVLRLIEDDALRTRVITTGFRNVERYRAENVAAAYAHLYRCVSGRLTYEPCAEEMHR